MTWTAELAHEISGQVLTDESARQAAAKDFGHIVEREPEAVIRPASSEDVARALKFAGKHGLSVSTRGAGHSQTGQSLSEQIVFDMSSLDQLRQVDDHAGTGVCQGGMRWRSLVERLVPWAMSPPVLTNNLDVTVGGTLSTAGLGVASWKYGTQADNCLELEVVTGTGEIARCSSAQNRELFDAVRAGMGQFGVITEVKLKLRKHRSKFRSYYLLYDNLNSLLEDLKLLMSEERFDYLESWCIPCPQGFKKVGSERRAFAEWFFPLHATRETDESSAPEAEERLRGLNFYKHVHTEEGGIEEFFARLDSLFVLWKRAGYWDFTHPWMECVLPWQAASFYIGQVLQNMPPQAIVGGHILLWPARGSATSVPLFMRPPGDLVMGFGILPAIPKQLLEDALPRLNQASQACMMVGGKRYLSGWIAFDAAQWKAHYGDNWGKVIEMKKRFDPKGILNPGFVIYD